MGIWFISLLVDLRDLLIFSHSERVTGARKKVLLFWGILGWSVMWVGDGKAECKSEPTEEKKLLNVCAIY